MADTDQSLYNLRYNQVTQGMEGFGGGTPMWTPLLLEADGGVQFLHADSSPNLSGTIQLVSGTNVTLSQVGHAITINSTGGSSSSPTNIIMNGGFELWSQGTTFTNPADSTFTSDRWNVEVNTTTGVTVSREATIVDTGKYSAKVVIASAGSGKFWLFRQYMDNFQEYANLTVSCSARVHSSVANKITITIGDGLADTTGAANTTTGAWETITCTKVMSAVPTNMHIAIGFVNSGDVVDSTVYYDSVMFTLSATPNDYVPVPGPLIVAAYVDSESATNGQVLTADGAGNATWQTAGGGGGSPGGASSDIQFNNSGAFGGSSKLQWDGANIVINGTGGSPGLLINSDNGATIDFSSTDGLTDYASFNPSQFGVNFTVGSQEFFYLPNGLFLLPPVDTTTRDSISPSEGEICYNVTLHKLQVYTGSAWETITSV